MHLKLRTAPVIYLVGFMGCGKSTVGRALAERLGWAFADLDEEIERRAGTPIAEIFERDGEPRFRELEHETFVEQLQLAHRGRARVIAMGGGAFAEERNREHVEHQGVSIWLDCRIEKLWDRVGQSSTRPLARDRAQFEGLFERRLPSYQSADFTVIVDTDDAGDLVAKILELPLFR